MGLELDRKVGQSVRILFDEDMTDRELRQLIRYGITVTLTDVSSGCSRARVLFEAPEAARILRTELLNRPREADHSQNSDRRADTPIDAT
ncbi:MAG: carbon storage regulator [Gammaproteobacteria bacterium]|uniref:Putative carbon storage regulator n=1 Tax=viral metagenome TaxID=1070528 RepID=A0A6M3J7Y4_9ZZZZ|nr:carbon storage regulator [Gammaproteobacteria bacterium]MBU1492214.1 carbon storage regulator [Gammaproteobacteria bacterium]MBU2066785.1 carbon storage regulator [Gammaproteobacteria bacterium]MBU2137399.1 carbon storage regulator [Gammaproteobacteria bacterium]MBU2215040.1 carbon storage regulator [Gammaproteobacteria bacterium]